MAKEIFKRVEDRQLTEWVLKNAPPDKALFMRALSQPLDRRFAVDVLCPVLVALDTFNPLQPEINERLVPLLNPEDLTFSLFCQMWASSSINANTGPLLAKKCFARANDDPRWVEETWDILKRLKFCHHIWEESTWRDIYEFLTDKNKSVETIQGYCNVFHTIFENYFPEDVIDPKKSWFPTLDPEEYWLLLRNYALSVNSKEQIDNCRRLWEHAIKTLPPKIREVSLREIDNLTRGVQSPVETAVSLINSMENKGWLGRDLTQILLFLSTISRFAHCPCDEKSAKSVEEHCEQFDLVLRNLPKYANSIFGTVVRDNSTRGACTLAPIIQVALKGEGDKDPNAQRMIRSLHNVIDKHSKSGCLWGFFLNDIYCQILLDSNLTLPHWWVEELAELCERHPEFFNPGETVKNLESLIGCALACGPGPDGDLHSPNSAMKKVYAVSQKTKWIANALSKGYRIKSHVLTKLVFLTEGNPDELSQLSKLWETYYQDLRMIVSDLNRAAEKRPHLWRWYLEQAHQLLLTAGRANFAVPPDEINKISFA